MKTLIFVVLLVILGGGALFMPILGVMGYVSHYAIGPERQWWAQSLRNYDLRYSYTLALLTAVGIVFNYRSLRFGKSLLLGQETLIMLFVGLMWVSFVLAESMQGRYEIIDHPTMKMTKVLIFVLMLTHIVTNLRNLDWLFWALTISALIVGLQAYDMRFARVNGRLEDLGGSDFTDSNFLGAYLAAMLPIIAVQFMRSKWIGKAVALVAGVFTTNAIILTRSRGALLGIAAGAVMAVFLAPRRFRIKILVGLTVALVGGFYLTDPGYRERASTINRPEDQRDASAQSRLVIWQAGIRMVADHPLLGVGVGNFHQSIGRYGQNLEGWDAHNTYVRCAGELGIPGLILLVVVFVRAIVSLVRTLRRISETNTPQRDHVAIGCFGLAVSLCTFLGSGFTMSLVYLEAMWWLLAMPACMERIAENVQVLEPKPEVVATKRRAFGRRRAVPVGER